MDVLRKRKCDVLDNQSQFHAIDDEFINVSDLDDDEDEEEDTDEMFLYELKQLIEQMFVLPAASLTKEFTEMLNKDRVIFLKDEQYVANKRLILVHWFHMGHAINLISSEEKRQTFYKLLDLSKEELNRSLMARNLAQIVYEYPGLLMLRVDLDVLIWFSSFIKREPIKLEDHIIVFLHYTNPYWSQMLAFSGGGGFSQ